MIDLSKLKVGDTVKFRDGTRDFVRRIDTHCEYPFLVTTSLSHRSYRANGTHNSIKVPSDIVEIIPKESEVNERDVKILKELAQYNLKQGPEPKRFVDLLALGVEYIACGNLIHTVKDGIIKYYSPQSNRWFYLPEGGFGLYMSATPAQNPEKKKKVVYQVLFRKKNCHAVGGIQGNYLLSHNLYATKEEFEVDYSGYPGYEFIRFIEESREEVEG